MQARYPVNPADAFRNLAGGIIIQAVNDAETIIRRGGKISKQEPRPHQRYSTVEPDVEATFPDMLYDFFQNDIDTILDLADFEVNKKDILKKINL